MIYRPDIDGLRALAVLSVILYHLGVPFVTGGFIGVDVFFVISGFLITQTIQNDIKSGKFTIEHFYIKRIRRIVPALFVVTFTTILFAIMILPLYEMKEFAKSVLSVATFTSNLFFWQHSDYFSVAAELKPLLHTWSLGIEEQFYILFPLFMLLSRKWTVAKTFIWVLLLFIIFFILNLMMIKPYPTETFYMPFTRFWELLAGVMLALTIHFHNRHSIIVNNLVSLAGLALVILPLFTLDYRDPFPGMFALAPVLGSVLIIYSGTERTWVSIWLSDRYVRYVGLISYSLYLWHWVVISFAKNVTIGEFSLTLKLFILVMTFFLAALTYHYVEQPFRRVEKFKKLIKIKAGLLVLAVLACFAFLMYLYTHMKQKEIPKVNPSCFKQKETFQSVQRCSFGDKTSEKVFLLYGDSHLFAIYPVFEKLAKEKGWRGVPAVFEGCAPLFNVFRTDGMGTASNCTGEYAGYVKKFLEENHDKIQKVYLVSRWTLYEKGWIKNGRLQKATHFLSNNSIQSETADQSRTVLKEGLDATVEYVVKDLNLSVVIVNSPPSLNTNIHRLFGVKPTQKKDYLEDMMFINNESEKLKKKYGISVIDPVSIFCPSETCKLYDTDEALYTDDNHVSVKGAMLYYPILEKTLETKEVK